MTPAHIIAIIVLLILNLIFVVFNTLSNYMRDSHINVLYKKHNDTDCFTSDGLGKITQHRKIGDINAAAVKIIDKMLENAEYSNFGQRKETDKQNVVGYLNFKSTAVIEGIKRHFRLSVKLKTDMKAYYNHTVNRYKEDKI